jgi:hypothetical protein
MGIFFREVSMRKTLLGMAIISALLTAQTAYSRSGSWMGPRTNAPGENSCTSCHGGSILNSPPGSTWMVAPGQYVPNDTVTLFASVESAGKVRWGFEVTALNSSNQPVGQMVVSDAANTRISTDGTTGRQYMFHTSAGTYSGTADSSLGWTFKWAAPGPGTGDVTFYMSGLAADGSGSGGDKTFTTSVTLTESLVSDVRDGGTLPTGFVLEQNYPNPFNPQTAISYQLPRPAEVQIAIYNVLGGQVRLLDEGYQSTGRHSRTWNGTDDRGREVAAGVYFYRLTAGDYVALRKMLLLK